MWGGSPCLLYFATERAPIERANEQIKDIPMNRYHYQIKKHLRSEPAGKASNCF